MIYWVVRFWISLLKSYSAGEIVIPVNAPTLTKGVYTYTVTVNGNSITKKMVVK